jgi:hypothetical protein
MLDLLAWRRDVSELYAAVRAWQPRDGHALWREGRDRLFTTSWQSPLALGDPRRTEGRPVAPYDPAWRVVVPVEPAEPAQRTAPAGSDGEVVLDRVGVLGTPW